MIKIRKGRKWFLVVIACCVLTGCQRKDPRGVVPDRESAREIRLALADGKSGGGSSKAEAPKRTGWGTLKGKFRVVGDVAENPILNIDRHQDVCQPGGVPVRGEVVKVDPATGGLANVLLYALKLKGDNVHESAASGKTDEILYDQEACRFQSHVLPVQKTQVLLIKNSDSVLHNTKIAAKEAKKINENIPPRSSIKYTPGKEEKEPIGVSCSVHPWMKAYLLPRDNGYFVVTAEDGSFEIPYLPAGIDLSIQVWHEKLEKGEGDFGSIQIVKGPKAAWKRGRIPLKLEDGQTVEFDVEIPAAALQ